MISGAIVEKAPDSSYRAERRMFWEGKKGKVADRGGGWRLGWCSTDTGAKENRGG